MSYYSILNLESNCSTDQIKQAYKDKARKLHPDKNPNTSDEQFKLISKAYSILVNPKLRKEYDLRVGIDR